MQWPAERYCFLVVKSLHRSAITGSFQVVMAGNQARIYKIDRYGQPVDIVFHKWSWQAIGQGSIKSIDMDNRLTLSICSEA